MARGWPKPIIEFRKVNASLADPSKHGGASKDAFDSVCPVLPGYGFSSESGEVWFGVETAGRVEQADAVFGLRHKFRSRRGLGFGRRLPLVCRPCVIVPDSR